VINPGRRAAALDQRGVTLVEIVVAVAIIGVGLVGLAVVIPVSSYGVQEGGQLSTATFLAEQMIERARAAAWSAAPALDCLGVSTEDAAPVPTEATCHGHRTTQFPDEAGGISSHAGYQRAVRVTTCETAPGCAGVIGAGLRRVMVTVTYTPLALGGGMAPGPRAVRLEWLASRK
jgi:prepilin-type N-terminal cleavage/methylation domain-containing protein